MKKRIFFVVFVCCLLFVLGAVWVKYNKEIINRRNCLSHLHAIGFWIDKYPDEHNGKYPQNLQEGFGNGGFTNSLRLLVCPGSGKSLGEVTNVASWADYTFISWPMILGTTVVPTNYPVAYDRYMSNHAGLGICILTGDGLVRWDPNCDWLRKFSAEHPEAKLPMPLVSERYPLHGQE